MGFGIEIDLDSTGSPNPAKYNRQLIVAAAGGDRWSMPCYSSRKVDQEWLLRAIGGMQTHLPPMLLYLLARTGQRLFFVEKPDDVGLTSREPDPDDHYRRAPVEIGGCYQPGDSIIYISRTSYRQTNREYKLNSDLEQVSVHEATHALDCSFLKIVDKPEFKRVYNLDVLKFGSNKKIYGYQRQRGRRGREEALAEISSHLHTGRCRAGNMAQDWQYSYLWSQAYFKLVEAGFNPKSRMEYWGKFSRNAAKTAELGVIQNIFVSEPDFAELVSCYASISNDKFEAHSRHLAKADARVEIWKEMLRNQTKESVQMIVRQSPAVRIIPGFQPV